MSSLQGYIQVGYSELVEAFGQPDIHEHNDGIDGKVFHEWSLSHHGMNFRIYDYKVNLHTQSVEAWHVGGENRYAVDAAVNLLQESLMHLGIEGVQSSKRNK